LGTPSSKAGFKGIYKAGFKGIYKVGCALRAWGTPSRLETTLNAGHALREIAEYLRPAQHGEREREREREREVLLTIQK
jgi:hypothetical protein